MLLHGSRKPGRSRWWKETGKKSNTAIKLHFVDPQVLLHVNRKIDKSRGRRESRRMNNTAVNRSFVICQLSYMSFARRRDNKEEEKLGEQQQRCDASFVILVIH